MHRQFVLISAHCSSFNFDLLTLNMQVILVSLGIREELGHCLHTRHSVLVMNIAYRNVSRAYTNVLPPHQISPYCALVKQVSIRLPSNFYLLHIIWSRLCFAPGHYNCSTHGEVRLRDGQTLYDGRVEVCLNGRWSRICNSDWGIEESQILCRQLGHPTQGMSIARVPIACAWHYVRTPQGNAVMCLVRGSVCLSAPLAPILLT